MTYESQEKEEGKTLSLTCPVLELMVKKPMMLLYRALSTSAGNSLVVICNSKYGHINIKIYTYIYIYIYIYILYIYILYIYTKGHKNRIKTDRVRL